MVSHVGARLGRMRIEIRLIIGLVVFSAAPARADPDDDVRRAEVLYVAIEQGRRSLQARKGVNDLVLM